MKLLPLRLVLVSMLLSATARAAEPAGANLVVNGSFDAEGDALAGWKWKYGLPGESEYFDNHEFISTTAEGGARKNVLKIHVPAKQAGWEGVKVDSAPVPIRKGARYSFSADARSTGPDARILLEGYRWRPGIKPHPNPELHELRKCYKFELLFFGQAGGAFSGVGRGWKTASQVIPKDNMKDLQKQMFGQVEFVVVHLIGIGGGEGDLFVDNVRIEEVK